jgi:hypothetical protein
MQAFFILDTAAAINTVLIVLSVILCQFRRAEIFKQVAGYLGVGDTGGFFVPGVCAQHSEGTCAAHVYNEDGIS